MELKYGNLVDRVNVEMGTSLFEEVEKDFAENFEDLQESVFKERGYIVPDAKCTENDSLDPYEYRILLSGIEKGRFTFLEGHSLCLDMGEVTCEVDGFPTVEPAFGCHAMFVSDSDLHLAIENGYKVPSMIRVIKTHLQEVLDTNTHNLLSISDVSKIMAEIEAVDKDLADYVLCECGYSKDEIRKILFSLLYEQVSIADIRGIFSALPPKNCEFEIRTAIDVARKSLVQGILAKRSEEDNLYLVRFSDDDIKFLVKSASEQGDGFPFEYPEFEMEEEICNQYLNKISAEVQKRKDEIFTLCFVVPSSIRFAMFEFLNRNFDMSLFKVVSVEEVIALAKIEVPEFDTIQLDVISTIEQLKTLELAASKGNEKALKILCSMYKSGEEENVQKYAYWLREWAKLGNQKAMEKLYLLLFQENGGVYDRKEGFFWLKKCAESGWTDSYELLSAAYAEGIGTRKNPEKAAYWRTLAKSSHK